MLLAEDNLVNQRVAARMLEQLGCVVTVVGTGLAALRSAADTDFDLVFMDIQMPQMDGTEATDGIRKLEGRKSKVPIVALTANAIASDREKFLAAGMDGYLSKPLTRDSLENALHSWARRPARGSGTAKAA